MCYNDAEAPAIVNKKASKQLPNSAVLNIEADFTECQQKFSTGLPPVSLCDMIGLSKPMLIIQPIRMNIKPNRDLVTCVFPRFAFPALIGSIDSLRAL